MRTLAVTQNITVDGAIEMLDSWFDPQGQADDDDLIEFNQAESQRCDTLLLGRQTFEDFRGYWPEQTDDRTGVSAELERLHKAVVSSTMTDPRWQNSQILAGDVVEEVTRLKGRPGREIVVTGSITLTHTLITAGLVDEVRLFTYPAVQGRGRRLFPDGYTAARLRLLDTRRFTGGVTFSSYALDASEKEQS